MARTRTTSHRRDVPVEHRPIPISGEARRRISQDFEAREASRGRGRAQATQEPVRRWPTRAVDGDVKMWISRGYSEEVARELAAQAPSVPSYWATRLGGEIV